MRIQLNDETTLYTLYFADDQVIIAQDNENLDLMKRKLFENYERWGLTENYTITKYLCIGGEQGSLTLNDGQVIGACDHYFYLGTGTEGREHKARNKR